MDKSKQDDEVISVPGASIGTVRDGRPQRFKTTATYLMLTMKPLDPPEPIKRPELGQQALRGDAPPFSV